MRPQKTIAQAMKGANPHAAHIDRQHAGEARHHLLGGLVGESHGQHAAGCHLPGLQQPGNAGGQHPGLAGAGPGQNQGMLGRQRHSRTLLGVKVLQQKIVRGALLCNCREHSPIVESGPMTTHNPIHRAWTWVLAALLMASSQTRSQPVCSSDDQAAPRVLFERFVNADCESCWSDASTPLAPRGALALDWIVPGRQGTGGRRQPRRADAAERAQP